MKRFFDSLNSEVYFLKPYMLYLSDDYDAEERDIYGTKNGESEILGKVVDGERHCHTIYSFTNMEQTK